MISGGRCLFSAHATSLPVWFLPNIVYFLEHNTSPQTQTPTLPSTKQCCKGLRNLCQLLVRVESSQNKRYRVKREWHTQQKARDQRWLSKPAVVQDGNPAGLNTINIEIKSLVAIHAELQGASAATGRLLPRRGQKPSPTSVHVVVLAVRGVHTNTMEARCPFAPVYGLIGLSL